MGLRITNVLMRPVLGFSCLQMDQVLVLFALELPGLVGSVLDRPANTLGRRA